MIICDVRGVLVYSIGGGGGGSGSRSGNEGYG